MANKRYIDKKVLRVVATKFQQGRSYAIIQGHLAASMGIKMVKEGDKKFNQAIEKVLSAAIAGAYSTKEATYATL